MSTIVFNEYKVESENMGDPSAPTPRHLHQACITVMGYGVTYDAIVTNSLIRFLYCHPIYMEIKYHTHANLKQYPVTFS